MEEHKESVEVLDGVVQEWLWILIVHQIWHFVIFFFFFGLLAWLPVEWTQPFSVLLERE
ncbi:hypothetical protein DsansV1_C23g0176591 [Dioscorea sansibarensis]